MVWVRFSNVQFCGFHMAVTFLYLWNQQKFQKINCEQYLLEQGDPPSLISSEGLDRQHATDRGNFSQEQVGLLDVEIS